MDEIKARLHQKELQGGCTGINLLHLLLQEQNKMILYSANKNLFYIKKQQKSS